MSFPADANPARTALAAARDVQVATYALDHWDPAWPRQWKLIATLRKMYPAEPWSVIAGRADLTKDTCASAFKRLRCACCRTLPHWCATCPGLTIRNHRPACCGHT